MRIPNAAEENSIRGSLVLKYANIVNESKEGFEFLQIFNLQGQLVLAESYKGGPLFLGDLPRGSYILKFQLESSVINKKVILK